MKRIVLQYLAMAFCLSSMLFAISFMRGYGSGDYMLRLGVFLVLLAWSTPFEASLGNLVMGATTVNIYNRQLFTRFNCLMVLRAFAIGLGFAFAFYYYPRRETAVLLAGGVGTLFFLRMLEYLLKTRLLLVNFGLEAQVIINCCTACKWLTACGALVAGSASFFVFVLCHIGFGIVCVLVQTSMLWQMTGHDQKATVEKKAGANIRDDFFSILGIGVGVFSYQLDKMSAGLLLDGPIFGEYVSVFTITFIGPYLLNPVFIVTLQRLSRTYRSVKERGETDQQGGETYDFAVLRLAALGVALASLILLGPIMKIMSKSLPMESFINSAAFVFASYLNCLAHIYYLDYLARGNFTLILKQNFASAVLSVITFMVLLLSGNSHYVYILVAAGVGQFAFGLLRRVYLTDEWSHFLDFNGMLLLLVFLLIYVRVFDMNNFNMKLAVLAITFFIVSLFCEARLLGIGVRRFGTVIRKFERGYR